MPLSESVKCRFSKCRFSVLNLKFDFISDGGCTREKQIQKALGSLPPCGNRCRFSETAMCSSRVHPPSEIKSNFKFKTLRWRPLRWRLTLSDAKKFCRGVFGYFQDVFRVLPISGYALWTLTTAGNQPRNTRARNRQKIPSLSETLHTLRA